LLLFLLTSAGAAELGLIQKAYKRLGSIKGRVVDEAGAPMANVAINVRPAGGSYEEEQQAATDDNGEFVVDHLSAKPYVIRCEASGYIEADPSSSYYLTGEPVTLKMAKGGVITGRVTGGTGEPYVKARVAAVRVRDQDGQPASTNEGTADTDDRGVYRIYGLESGYYIVNVGRAGQYEDNQLRNAVPIYYPSVTRDGARQLAVARGQEIGGIDITYRSEPGHIVSGSLSGVMRSGSEDETIVRLVGYKAGAVLQKGFKENRTFIIYGVPDGDYFVVAQNDSDTPTAASQPYRITVKGADVRGIDLRLVPFASASGKVSMGPAPEPRGQSECKGTRPGLVQEAVVWAARDEMKNANVKPAFPPELFDDPEPTAPNENGEFSLQGLAPGHYRFGATVPNEAVYISAISMRAPSGKAIDIGSTGASLKSSDQLAGVSIILAEGAAAARGRVVSSAERAKLPSGLRVHLVPAEPQHANDVMRFAEAEVKSDGTFALTNIAPGRYRIVTVPVKDPRSVRAAWDADERASLLRRAEESGGAPVVELKPCQQLSDYVIRYP
jgi:protocatechuate 3,4-dioxygenase beta subunit